MLVFPVQIFALVILLAFFLALSYVLRVGPARSVSLAQYLAILAHKGLPVAQGLEAYSQDQRGGFARAVLMVGQVVKQGHSLAEAMALRPKVFPAPMIAMVRVGEETGTLPQAMVSYASQYQQKDRLAAKLVIVLLYPLVGFAALLGIGIIILVKIIPQFEMMLWEMGLDLPWLTQKLFQVGALAQTYWYLDVISPLVALGLVMVALWLDIDVWVVTKRSKTVAFLLIAGIVAFSNLGLAIHLAFIGLGMIGLGVLVLKLSRSTQDPLAQAQQGPAKVPVFKRCLSDFIGRGWRLESTATFCETLAMLMRNGVPSPKAIAMAAIPGRVGRADQAMWQIRKAVAEGEKLSSAVIRELHLPESDAWMLATADGTPDFPAAIEEVGRRSRERSLGRYAFLNEALLPICVFLEGLLILFVCTGVLAPIFSLM